MHGVCSVRRGCCQSECVRSTMVSESSQSGLTSMQEVSSLEVQAPTQRGALRGGGREAESPAAAALPLRGREARKGMRRGGVVRSRGEPPGHRVYKRRGGLQGNEGLVASVRGDQPHWDNL